MMNALLALALMPALFQEKSPPKTLEERLKELEDKLGALEKRHKALEDENQALEKKIGDAKAARETFAKQTASGWVTRYAKVGDFTEKQSAELEGLWLGWIKGDWEKLPDAAAWKAREEQIKKKLAGEQVKKLIRAVRDEQEKGVKFTVRAIAQMARISSDHAPALEKAVMAKVSVPEGMILPEAHSEIQAGWLGITATAQQALPDLGSVLSEEELSRLRELLGGSKPRR